MQNATVLTVSAPQAEESRLPCRKHETWSRGDTAHQGDLILVCLAAMPTSAKPRSNRQLAEGDTRGSKHVVAGGKVYDADRDELVALIKKATNGAVVIDPKYAGPVFSGPCVLEHPEHQHQGFGEGSITAVVFQRNLDAEETEQRARD